jgi:hypothetical protein
MRRVIACALDGAELDDRLRAWQRLADEHLREQTEVRGGVALAYADAAGVEETVRRLARLEGACCGWATWRVERAAGAVRLEVTAPAGGEAALRAMFAPR